MHTKLIQAFIYYNPDIYPPVINSLRLLVQAGYRIELICRGGDGWGVDYPDGVSIYRVAGTAENSWRSYARFVSQALLKAKRSASLFIGHDMHGLLPAKLLASYYGRPLVYHCHDFAEDNRALPTGSELVRTFERRHARGADIVIVPDADRANVVAEQLRLARPPIIVANSPLRRPVSRSEALSQALAAKNISLDKIVLRQGRVGPGHAIEATLQSIRHWQNKRWGFVVMGTGEQSYVDKLLIEARDLGVEKQFVVLPPVGYDQVSTFTPAADLGHGLYESININHTYYSTASNKIMEYMEAGLPLLVSDMPSLRTLINNYSCGVAADEKSPESIASAVNMLLSDVTRSRNMGYAARQAFENVFCYERQFAGVISSFQSLV